MVAAAIPPTTQELRTYHVSRCAREVASAPESLSGAELLSWFAAQEWAPNTRRSYRASLRAFYAWAITAGYVEASPADALPAVRVPRGRPRPTPETDYRIAIAASDERARLAIMLAGTCGLRRGELARVRREDIEADLTGWSLRVVGKGGHVRMVPLTDELAALLRARPAGWVFPSSHRPGHLTPAHLGKVISAHLPDGMTTHTLRHRCGTVAYAATRDLRAVQELLGHSKPETTALYTAVPNGSIRAAVDSAA